ncbi:MAG: DUF58 domain-containing protein, partial [Candidatus Promineifilaceae bacterium]|nr:DUF58 domain-containing protein [Candidatus Promineifilaceae bacterium]
FIFYIIYVIVGIYVWSLWLTPRAFRKLGVERSFNDHAFLGERVTVAVTLRNEGRLPLPWIQAVESVPPELSLGAAPRRALTLRGRQESSFTYQVQATRRGYYRLGPLSVRSGDLFGWKEELKQTSAGYLTVYPRIIPLTELGLPSRLPFGTIRSQQRLFEDPARPVGVRDYRAGDSMRLINWKVSAHHENLVVRTLQPAISLETAILLNLNVKDYDRRTRYSVPEWAIEVAASIAAHLVDHKQAVGLMTNGSDPLLQQPGAGETGLAFDDVTGRVVLEEGAGREGRAPLIPTPIPPQGGRAHLMKVLELLARVEAAATVPFTGWIPRACLHLSWGVTIPVITPQGDEATCQALHGLVRAGFNPVLIVVSRSGRFGQVRERAQQLGFPAYQVLAKEDLETWRRPAFTGLDH